jgi:aminoglycoside phosphotransferase (APT) family kinase protein
VTDAASLLDRAGSVRSGEELDAERVDAFLKSRIAGLEGAPQIHQFARGASNLTYLVSYAGRDLVLRRPPFGHKAKGAHDMGREVRVMRALKPFYGVVPTVLAHGDDASVMGCEFYVMERIAGLIPRQDLPPELGLGPQETRRLCRAVIDKLIELHRIDPAQPAPATAADAPPPLLSLGRGEGFVQRQLDGWSRQFRDARTDDVGDFEPVMAWLAHKRPPREVAVRVVHGDFRFDNVVLDPADPCRVIGVLDWEMATLGDPLMDLGNALAYWVQADDDAYFRRTRRQPTDAPGMLTRAEVVAHYAAGTGLAVANFDFYAVFGIFRLAVIVQQIWRRYREGATRDPQFAAFGPLVNYLEQRCTNAIALSTL